MPEGIVFHAIDPATGLLSTEACARTLREAFMPGTEPRKYCDESAAAAPEVVVQDEAP